MTEPADPFASTRMTLSQHLDELRRRVLRGAIAHLSNLSTTGRQGLFRYNNMDHSIAMGRAFADRIANGSADSGAEAIGLEREYFG